MERRVLVLVCARCVISGLFWLLIVNYINSDYSEFEGWQQEPLGGSRLNVDVKKTQVQTSFPEKAADSGGSSWQFKNRVLHQLGLLCSRKMVSAAVTRPLECWNLELDSSVKLGVSLFFFLVLCSNHSYVLIRLKPDFSIRNTTWGIMSHLQQCDSDHDSRAKSGLMQPVSPKTQDLKTVFLFF